VSWPLASFAIVAGALLAGWLAYERARPSARSVAVVATLAALAALGRDAFAALPDVKPITAMALVVGYALGPLAGFMVGALGMLASNIVLGQGPYTPWQMAAWGLVGLIGAGLGRLSGRSLGRLPLALACAAAALAAKEIMNLYVFTLGGIYTPAALLARVAEGLPFDLADTISSFLFGLAFAPELARLLVRVRARLHVHWDPVGGSLAALVLALVLAGLLGPGASTPGAWAQSARTAGAGAALARARAYLEGAQNADGGFGGEPGERSSELYSSWAAIGLAAAGRDPLSLAPHGRSVLDALAGEASTLEGTGDMERTILALHACGVPARSLGAIPLEADLLHARRPDGSFGGQVNLTAFAILALRAEGRAPSDPAIQAAARWLAEQQNADGGFGFAARGAGSEVDDTGAVLQAIAAAGVSPDGLVRRAEAYLAGAQSRDGGFPQQAGGESNAQSTAWAVQGLIAVGQQPAAFTHRGSPSPIRYLEGMAGPGGSVRYSRASTQTPVWVTAEALAALAGRPFPIAPVRRHGSAPAPQSSRAPGTGPAAARSQPATGRGQRGAGSGLPAAAGRHGRGSAGVPGTDPEALAAALTQELAGLARAALATVGVAIPGGSRAAPARGSAQRPARAATASAAGSTAWMSRAQTPA
jgi:energy-coupling factor transport system substrate-specific component